MAIRTPHIIKTYKSNQQPNTIIWFDTETQPKIVKGEDEHHYLWFGWACYQRRNNNGKWSAPDWFRFETVEQFWTWVFEKTRKKTRLYMFSHNGGFDLPVVSAFSYLPAHGWDLDNAIVDSPPLVVTWKSASRTIKFIDTLNYWRMPLKAIGESIGHLKIDMPDRGASSEDWDRYGKQDTEIIRRVVLAWLDFLSENDLGGFAATLASQAMNAFRHRFMKHPIYITDRKRALLLDRDSYLGGRTECFKMGKHRGHFYYVDVNSMYPSVMFEQEFPTKLIDTVDDPSLKELAYWLDHSAVVSHVTIETDEAVYPIVKDGKLVFPVGEFECTLAGPELQYALEHDHIKTIGLSNIFDKAPIFKEFIAFMYLERLKAKANGDVVNTWLYKILMNSLYGKFGQRGRRYEYECDAPTDAIHVWTDIDADTGIVRKYRMFGGIIQEWHNEDESRESFPAIASYVTSYARLKLWYAIKAAGRANCYYCDTDSLVVNKAGYEKLADQINPSALGAWALESELKYLELRGPKDYTFDKVKKVKGIRANATWLTDSTVEQLQFVGLRGLLQNSNLSAPIIRPIYKTMTRNYNKGTITDELDVLPLRIIPL